MTELTLAEAEQILAGALRCGERLGTALSVAVVDARGQLISVKRSDGAAALTSSMAIAKAYSAVFGERPDNVLHEWARQNPTWFAQLAESSAVGAEGGATISRGGQVLGGLGVCGGTPAQDQRASREVLVELGYEQTGG